MYLASLAYNTELLVNFENLNIQFDSAYQNVWYDPENDTDPIWGGRHAVLNLTDTSASPVVLTLANVSVTGPPALDPLPVQPVPSGRTYTGEPATTLVLATAGNGWEQDSGSITNSTFTGGPVSLGAGPWQITGNHVNGALAYTYSADAFDIASSHDLTVENNTIVQVAANATEFRFLSLRINSFNDVVSGNSFTGGAVGNESTYSTAPTAATPASTIPRSSWPKTTACITRGWLARSRPTAGCSRCRSRRIWSVSGASPCPDRARSCQL